MKTLRVTEEGEEKGDEAGRVTDGLQGTMTRKKFMKKESL